MPFPASAPSVNAVDQLQQHAVIHVSDCQRAKVPIRLRFTWVITWEKAQGNHSLFKLAYHLLLLVCPVHLTLTCKVYWRTLKWPEVTGDFLEELNYCFSTYFSGSASLILEKKTPQMFVKMKTSVVSSFWWLRKAALFLSHCFEFIQWVLKRYH